MAKMAAVVALVGLFVGPVAASSAFMDASNIEQQFNAEVRGYAGKGEMNTELPAIRKALEADWLALPKSAEGRMQRAEVQELLKRFFLAQHEFEISEAATRGETVNKEALPAFLMELVEEVFGHEGLLLHEVSLVASTSDRLLKDETLWVQPSPAAEEAVEILKVAPETISGNMVQLALGSVAILTAVVAASDAVRRFGGVQVAKGKVQ
eukprot:TRINITY_DN58786_c0_g1_i1.p2 TRINITY_DN58786_c0_g1~~TRINITY_DN58786_c0_g1_i1.p2  ORF type:complete len:209 (+),score=77.77 TRINITY_DN58786_c0_g1_i1:336-962(+)